MTTKNELTEKLIEEALRNSEAGKYFYDIWYAGTVSQQEKWMKMFEAGMKAGFELGQKGQWQPIETAPKDGSDFLAYEKGYGINTTWWDSKHDGGSGGFRNPHHGWRPTHWMPLPESPGE